ncbi:MAG: hypothetical protein U5J82_08280 [Desulfobacterales bacterium]|nr:hypothetical protein [Desulfobacterales bacterium]
MPCPSHDNPLVMIPKSPPPGLLRRPLQNDDFKEKLLNDKEYDWVFRDTPCTICSSLYEALQSRLKSPQVFELLYARPYRFNRRLGEGISVFTPGDPPRQADGAYQRPAPAAASTAPFRTATRCATSSRAMPRPTTASTP